MPSNEHGNQDEEKTEAHLLESKTGKETISCWQGSLPQDAHEEIQIAQPKTLWNTETILW